MRSAIWYISLLPKNSYYFSSEVVLSCCCLFCCFVSFSKLNCSSPHHVFYIMFSPFWGEWPSYIIIYLHISLSKASFVFISVNLRSVCQILLSESVETDCKNTFGMWNVYIFFSWADSGSWLVLYQGREFKGCWEWGWRRRCVSVHRCSNIWGEKDNYSVLKSNMFL